MAITYSISNHEKNAYLPQINITSSKRLPFWKIPSNCNLLDCVLVCNLNQDEPLAQGQNDSLTVVYDVSNLRGESLELSANVYSYGQDSFPEDNIKKDVILLKRFTEIEIVG